MVVSIQKRAGALIAVVTLLVSLSGCGGGKPTVPRGKVSGKITVGGQPLTAGTVNFDLKAGGYGAAAKLDDSGSYSIPDGIPVGTYTVYVSPPEEMPVGPGETRPSRPKAAVEIPVKYRSAPTSDLTAEVKAGENAPFSFDLPK